MLTILGNEVTEASQVDYFSKMPFIVRAASRSIRSKYKDSIPTPSYMYHLNHFSIFLSKDLLKELSQ